MSVFGVLCFIGLFSTTMAAWVGQAVKVLEVFSSGSQTYVGGRYFAENAEALGEKVALLNAITLAKGGDDEAAKSELTLMAVQVATYDLPNTIRQALALWTSIMAKDPSFAVDTVEAGKEYLKIASEGIEQEVNSFYESNPNPTEEAKKGLRERLKDFTTRHTPSKEARTAVLRALDGDMVRAQRLARTSANTALKLRAAKINAWFQAFKTEFKKDLWGKFFGSKVGVVGLIDPIVDIIGIGLSINGIVLAIKNDDTKGKIINSIGLVASVVGVVTWILAVGGVPWAGPVNVVVGLVAAVVMLIIELHWRNPTIEAANEFSKLAFQELDVTFQALQDPAFKNSFGWVYQANAGNFLLGKNISPDSPLSFRHPMCEDVTAGAGTTTPCNPKSEVYNDNKRYLVLGIARHSTNPKFTLDVPYDFIGLPNDRRFCGNTISVNTLAYFKSLRRRNIRVFRYLRSLNIDTRNVPNYRETSFRDQEYQTGEHYNLTSVHQRDQNTEIKQEFKKSSKEKINNVDKHSDQPVNNPVASVCSPSNDRIEIDLLRQFDPRGHRTVTIKTGAGKDILSIGGSVGEPDDPRTTILNVDLGSTAEANVLSLGYALNVDAGGRTDLIAGVVFDNTGGQGKVCYVKHDLVRLRCVGNVRGVTVFKGSREYDTIVFGGHGPWTVIENYGANEYHFKIQDLVSVLDPNNKDDMCPIRWSHRRVNNQDQCYLLLDAPTDDLDEASKYCQEQGSTLVSIHNQAENDFVAGQGSGARWIGLTDSYKETRYRWVDGSTIDDPPYLKFAANQNAPPTPEGRSCTILDPSRKKEWFHSSCTVKHAFTCRKPLIPDDDPSKCSTGWISHSSNLYTYCYKAFGATEITEQKSWFEAVKHCRDLESALCSIEDEVDNNFVASLISQSQWIGLEDNWQKRFSYWTDGSRREGYSNWADEQLDDNDYKQQCVMLEAGKWKTRNCEEEKPFTCENLSKTVNKVCPKGWKLYLHHCFLPVTTPKTWSEANEYCSHLKAGLTRPISADKNAFINDLHNAAASWIGLSDRFKDRQLHWLDGSPLDYTNWLDDDVSVDQENSDKHCVTMNSNGKWAASKCQDSGSAERPMCVKGAHSRLTYELLDISTDARPVVKIFVPDNMREVTVQYDENNKFIDVIHPSLGHVARIQFSTNSPLSPQVYLIRGSGSPQCIRHSVPEP